MAISALALAVVSIGACARNDADGTDIGTERADTTMADTSSVNRSGQAAMQDSTALMRDTSMTRDTMRAGQSQPQSSGTTTTTPPQEK